MKSKAFRTLSWLLMVFVLSSICLSAFNIRPAKAAGTIYIRADGSVDPPTAPISVTGATYSLTEDVFDETIIVQKNSVIVDGGGYSLEGSGNGVGILLWSLWNVTIKRFTVTNFDIGISFNSTTSSLFVENTLSDNDIGAQGFGGEGNRFLQNYFANSMINCLVGGANFWNDLYPCGGNYWSDYLGADVKTGPGQDKPGSDGLGDTPHVIDASNQDNYPLVPLSQTGMGPRMDTLFIKYYNGSGNLFEAFSNRGEVDLTDMRLFGTRADEVFNDTSIQAAMSPSYGVFGFDFNNNATVATYPEYVSPTAYREFRQGITCLVNKTLIVNDICNYSYRIDTPFARPCFDWWVDWSVSQYDSQGNLLGNYPYEFNSTLAAHYFDQGEFLEGPTVNPYYDPSFPGSAQHIRQFPAGHPQTGHDLDPLIFYVRNDSSLMPNYHQGRLEAGRNLRDNLRKLGIPVNATEADYRTCLQKVMIEGDYHIYTMGWSVTPRECLSIYSGEAITEEAITNYPHFRNSTYDALVEEVELLSNLTAAREAALECQKILIEEAVCVWVFSTNLVKGFRNIHGAVDARGELINNRWTFLNCRTDENSNRSAIRYGLSSFPVSLNIVKDYSRYLSVFDRIYDTLLSMSPYDKSPDLGELMPWMAEVWEIGTWESPYIPSENLVKLTFHLRDNLRWHDGTELNSTDVKFTIEYLKQLGSQVDNYLESLVSSIHHVTTPDARTVIVYENVSSRWILYDVGLLPILPKHVFEGITDLSGYWPGANEGYTTFEGLIGSGSWRYLFHNSSMLWLKANRNHFMETPPEAEVDFRFDWEIGCWVVDGLDATMIGEAFGTSGDGVPTEKWESGCDIAKGDCKVDLLDVAALAAGFGATWGASAERAFAVPVTETAVWVETPSSPTLVGQNITAQVKMDNFTSLSGFQFRLTYDNTKLECLEMTTGQIFGSNTYVAKSEVNQTLGHIWISLTSLDQTQLNDNATVATIVFNATKPGSSWLDLWNTKLAQYGALGASCQPIPHEAIDRAAVIGVTTPTGTNVNVEPSEDTQVTFTSTTTEGITTLETIPLPSTEFVSAICCDIETTANYTGDITIQFSYDPTGMTLEDEQAMRIWLWNESLAIWVDITTTVDTTHNIVYGVAPHLSIFGVTRAISLAGQTSGEGETTVGFPASQPDPPFGLEMLACYEIKSTEFVGGVELRLEYDASTLQPMEEQFIQVWLLETFPQPEWVDVTTSVDTGKNIVYGATPHLSIFGVTRCMQSPAGTTFENPELSKNIVGQGYNVILNYTVQNHEYETVTFDLAIYCNITALTIYHVVLIPQAQTTLTFTWNTTGVTKGNYTLSACGRPLTWVFVTLAGDVDGNKRVDIFDLVRMAGVYNAKMPDPKYNPLCDIDGDGDIDIFDIVITAGKYGQHW